MGKTDDLERRRFELSENLRALMDWEGREVAKVLEGKSFGLDGAHKERAPIRAIRDRVWKVLLEEYKAMPQGTKLNLFAPPSKDDSSRLKALFDSAGITQEELDRLA